MQIFKNLLCNFAYTLYIIHSKLHQSDREETIQVQVGQYKTDIIYPRWYIFGSPGRTHAATANKMWDTELRPCKISAKSIQQFQRRRIPNRQTLPRGDKQLPWRQTTHVVNPSAPLTVGDSEANKKITFQQRSGTIMKDYYWLHLQKKIQLRVFCLQVSEHFIISNTKVVDIRSISRYSWKLHVDAGPKRLHTEVPFTAKILKCIIHMYKLQATLTLYLCAVTSYI